MNLFTRLLGLYLLLLGLPLMAQRSLQQRIDSLLAAPTTKPFNGIVQIAQNGRTIYKKSKGYAHYLQQTQLLSKHQFVIGSISKQFTAVIVLREYDKGHIRLHTPIGRYLPNLSMPWKDTVTVHQLLTHTHGIVALDKPLAFVAGTKYAYSQIGYDLLAKIAESTSRKSFATLSNELFKACKMYQTFHPDKLPSSERLLKGFTEQPDGRLVEETETFENYVAAGAFISTAQDLIIWDTYFFGGKLLQKNTYKLLTTKQKNAHRAHPIFGPTDYGYGITVDTKDHILQLGQTGFAPGFISMNFYFPATQTSVVVLDNVVWDSQDLFKTFYYHLQILKAVRQAIGNTN
ncbi:serine hydrolase domain-containing protein [Flectobacillus major]|uniref:serine hydrolase domain-containing protein n=1 Tax=Flectobacillus major TaxID=103 RepID=UPI0006940ED2|nr:serine hydrolase domain-containing protein [Flectobacillus major]